MIIWYVEVLYVNESYCGYKNGESAWVVGLYYSIGH